MEVLIENIVIYGFIFGIVFLVMFIYLKKTNKRSKKTEEKIVKAKEYGFHEPVSLHPVINAESCIGSGACIEACPEKDILGWVSGKSKTINTSRCVGHGACFHACPVLAITLCIGTEKRGVELPHISQQFETNIPMLFIAGELGGMGLIKNAVEQGKQIRGEEKAHALVYQRSIKESRNYGMKVTVSNMFEFFASDLAEVSILNFTDTHLFKKHNEI